MKRWQILSLFCLGLAGCSQSPMDKLKSDVTYSELNQTFWGAEQDQKTALWQAAIHYCQQNQNKPNCAPVLWVSVVSQGSTQLVPLNSHPLHR